MKIRLLAFASAADAVGASDVELEVPDGGRLPELRGELNRRYPALEPLWPRLAVAVDGVLARDETPLRDGAEVALLPPVSGGAPAARAEIVDEPLKISQVLSWVSDPSCGALVAFIGTARERHDGRDVEKLVYDAYRPMARQALLRIVTELAGQHPGLRVAVAHRLGEVAVGEPSVVIATASPHRETAYLASREALERLKREAPIWKQEHYRSGGTEWREEEPLRVPAAASNGDTIPISK